MRETRADTVQSLVLAVLLHVLLFGLVFLGLFWTRKTADPAGPRARLGDVDDVGAALRHGADARA